MDKIEQYKDSLTTRNKVARLCWNVFCVILFRPFGLPVFNGWRNFVLRMFGANIGAGSIVYASAKIWYPKNLYMGKRVCIGPNVNIYNPASIKIGDKVTISQGSHLCTATHDITSINKPLIVKPIAIGSFSWICAEVFVAPGINIGEGAVIGARAAVFKDVEQWTVVGGNPAKFIKKRELK